VPFLNYISPSFISNSNHNYNATVSCALIEMKNELMSVDLKLTVSIQFSLQSNLP